jgi:hypothetical protein
MMDEHFSRETLERFFRSELSREESRDFVRHLLRQCPRCSQMAREVAQRENFQLLLRGLESVALRSDPVQAQPALATVSPFPRPGGGCLSPPGETKRRSRAGGA